MRISTRTELYKLRELVHFLLAGAGGSLRGAHDAILCCFCKKELFHYGKGFTTHGNSVGPKLDVQVTVHHLNDNHDDNRLENKALCHTSCHKSHHLKQRHAQRAANAQGDRE